MTTTALLTHWDRAKAIIEEFIADKLLHERLKDQIDDWKNEGHLIPAEKLDKAEDLLERMRPLLNVDLITLIEASIQKKEEQKLQEKKRKHKYAALLLTIVLITIFFAVNAVEFVDEKQRLDVVGDWEYIVSTKNKDGLITITHGGDGKITSAGGENLIIEGNRRYSCKKIKEKNKDGKEIDSDKCDPNGELLVTPKIHWGTNANTNKEEIGPFALRIKGENVLHFVYYIKIGNKIIQAYCYLKPSGNSVNSHTPNELEGNYTSLAPDTLQGHVRFIRREKGNLEAAIEQRIMESGKKHL